ncbi:MAG: hypothetical protein WD231_01770 [Candidatus Woykebacteria bacterium]
MKILSKEKISEQKNKILRFLPYPKAILFLIAFLFLLVGIKLYFTNLLATSGVRITATSQKIEKLEKEKADLENKISDLGSIYKLQKEAKKIGLKGSDRVEVLTVPNKPLAQKP